MEKLLSNKVAIITGGGTGIGEAISKKFAQEGAHVIVCGLHTDPLDEVVNEIHQLGGSAISYKGDMSIEDQARDCVNFAVRTFGKLDILINNAGAFPEVDYIQEYSNDSFYFLLKNNIETTYMMTKYAIPELQKTRGCIVAAGSEVGLEGDAQNAPYAGTKGFIHAFIRSVAMEQAYCGIRANVVAPGPIDTKLMKVSKESQPSKIKMVYQSAVPMGRFGTPEEVANVYLFLASDLASYITGAIYSVDGGVKIVKGPSATMVNSSMKIQPEKTLEIAHSEENQNTIRY